MNEKLNLETEALLNMLIDENLKYPDKSGSTPLLLKAYNNSTLSPLSPEKKFEEDVVCSLVKFFEKLNQIHFSELESYIDVSEFTGSKIVEAFREYVLKSTKDEDIIFKACVARSIQHLSRTSFSLDYIRNRFKELSKLDPWLLAEIIIKCNWNEGVNVIKNLLETNPDSSYLFSLLPGWINEEKDKEQISYALTEWFDLLTNDDKEIARYYASNFGYRIDSVDKGRLNERILVKDFVEDEGFKSFVKTKATIRFKTLYHAE